MKKRAVNILKHFAAMCITAILLGTSFGISSLATETKNDTTLLNRLGISAVYNENALITRGDFTALAVQSLGISLLEEKEPVFSDISGIQGQYVNTAARIGLVKANDTGLFYPDRIITVEEAAAICLRILGYDSILKDAQYPNGYIAQASRLNLLSNTVAGAKLTGADAAKMIFKTLDTEYIDQNFLNIESGKTEYFASERTYMEEVWGIYKIHGQITSVCGLALDGFVACNENEIKIDNRVYSNPYYSDYEYYKYLGRNVKAYIIDTKDASEVLFIEDRSGVKNIDFRDVEKVCGFNINDTLEEKNAPKITYYDKESKKNRTLKLDRGIATIVNGEQSVSLKNEDFIGETGDITLIDGDNNGFYDVAVIEQYKYYHVAYFDEATQKIVDKKKQEAIDLSEFDKDDIYILSGGREVGIDSIDEDVLLQVMCSYLEDGSIDYSKKIVMTIRMQIVEGQIESFVDDSALYINGKYYDILSSLKDELKNRVGRSTTFLLGDDDLIVAYEDFKDGEASEYGYLVAIANEKNFGYDFTLRIYTVNEEMIDLKLSDKFRFTGLYEGSYVINRRIKSENISKTIAPRQLIKYQLDENGKLDLIELAYDHSTDASYKGFDKNCFSLDWKSDNDGLLGTYVGDTYRADGNSIFFYVSTTSNDEADFSVGSYNTKGTSFNGIKIKAYDSTQSLMAGVVVIEDLKDENNVGGDSLFSSPISIVVDKRYSRNDDGEFAICVELYNGNGIYHYFPKEENLAPENEYYYNIPTSVKSFDQLKEGDIILYNVNKKSEIERYVVVGEYDPDNDPTPYWNAYSGTWYGNPHASFNRIQGRVTTFEPQSHLTVDGSGNQKFGFNRSGVVYCEYDVENHTAKRLSYVPYLNEGDYVWIYAYRNDLRYIVRYITE